jgi:O-antigen/teichoic acid export membrane protein
MSFQEKQAVQQLLDGTVRIFLAESLMLPTGLLTVVFLTRKLGPEEYGSYALAAGIVYWIAWTVTSIYSRATIKFVSEAEDWGPIGGFVLRLSSITGLSAAMLLWALAPPIAGLLNIPSFAFYLRLFTLEVLLISLSQAHKVLLTGLGKFRQRSIVTSVRWIARLALIILLVELGLSLTGAVLGSILASLVELLVCRYFIRPSPFCRGKVHSKHFWSYSLPLLLFVLSLRLFEKIDLFALKALGGSIADAGIYAAAQNLTLIPAIFGLAFSTPLLPVLTRLLHSGQRDEAKTMAVNGMRAVLLLLPFAGLTAGAASEIVGFVFGESFLPAAQLLALLIFAALALVMVSVTSAILTAVGKPGWTFFVVAPSLPTAIAGYYVLIPRMGATGAAIVTTVCALLMCSVAIALVYLILRVLPPLITLLRSTIVCIAAYAVASAWAVPGAWLLLKISAISILILALFILLGELSSKDAALVKVTFRPGRSWQ